MVLGPTYPHAREGGSDSRAITAAKAMLESRGNTPRLFRNTLAFLAADDTRLQDLEDGVRRYLAWQSILVDRGSSRPSAASGTTGGVPARLPPRAPSLPGLGETYQWLLVPVQTYPPGRTWNGKP